MPTTIKVKDTTGTIQTINIDPAFQIEMTVTSTTTETSIKITDPIGSQVYDFVGSKPKR